MGSRLLSRMVTGGRKSRGAVLVMALLIVAAVASLAVSFASTFQLSLARGENRWHGAQANAYLVGAESLAIGVLKKDAEDSDVDNLDELWAQPIPPFPVEGGWVGATLEDAQGRFNINALVGKAAAKQGQTRLADRFTTPQRRFIRLLQTFEEVPVTEQEAVEVMEAIVDWLDQDDNVTGFGGAESLYYGQLEDPYHPANALFSSASELRLIRNVTQALYQALLPLVEVLPEDSGMNVNTMSIPLLRSLQAPNDLQPLSLEDGERLASGRGIRGYDTVLDFATSDTLVDVLPAGTELDVEGLVTESDYFILKAESQLIRQRRRLTSLLERSDGVVTPVRRRDS